MAEIPTSDYLHRSIDQLRSMNERGVLSSLSHLTSTDLRTAQLVHDYKPFNMNLTEFRQNVERLDYSIKNGLVGNVIGGSLSGLDRQHHQHHQHHQQQQQQQQQQQHQQQQQQQQQQQVGVDQNQHQRLDMKQSYSAPSTPPTPTLSDQETKFNPKSDMINGNGGDVNDHRGDSSGSIDGRDTKPYKCTDCSKTFANSSYLSQHTRIHLGIKPYRCEICQRKFTQLSHLQQHIRTHTGDKPYKCRHQGCLKAFSQLSNLQSHSRCHQTDKPFKCNSCYKCFTDELTLLEHIPKHKDSKHLKTHICNLCGKSYTQETYLQKHLQKHAEKAEKQNHRTSVTAAAAIAAATTTNVNNNNNNNNNNLSNINNVTNGGSALVAAGLGLNLNRNIVMAAATGSEHAYWPKVSPDSAAATLAEVIQQQQQQNGYNFSLQQQQQQQGLHQHQRSLLDQHRLLNGSSSAGGGSGVGGGGNGSGGAGGGGGSSGTDSTGSGNTPNHQSQSPNDESEDLVITRHSSQQSQQQQQQHLLHQQQHQQQQQQHNQQVSVGSNGNYDVKTTSAFTPINTIAPHLNALGHHVAAAAAAQRPSYLYDAIQSIPNQLISLHQIRNYAHQPTSGAGLLSSTLGAAGDHLLGLGGGGVGINSGGVSVSVGSKDKTQ